MMNNLYIFEAILVMSLAMLILRFLPFIFLSNKNSKTLMKLGNILPSAIVAMLVVYCLKDLKISFDFKILPAIVGVFITAILQYLKRNMLISIVAGTVCYMVLLQVV